MRGGYGSCLLTLFLALPVCSHSSRVSTAASRTLVSSIFIVFPALRLRSAPLALLLSCSFLLLSALSLSLLAPSCTFLYLLVPPCTSLHLPARSCALLRPPAFAWPLWPLYPSPLVSDRPTPPAAASDALREAECSELLHWRLPGRSCGPESSAETPRQPSAPGV